MLAAAVRRAKPEQAQREDESSADDGGEYLAGDLAQRTWQESQGTDAKLSAKSLSVARRVQNLEPRGAWPGHINNGREDDAAYGDQ